MGVGEGCIVSVGCVLIEEVWGGVVGAARGVGVGEGAAGVRGA